MGGTMSPLGWAAFGAHWHVQAWWLVFSVLAVSGYLGAVIVARRHAIATVHPARIGSFLAGIVVLQLTLSSAIDSYAMALFWDHMIEHLLLIMVVPVLLVLGHPISALRAAASAYGKERAVDAFFSSRPIALLTHPAIGLVLYTAVIVGTHLTGFMDAMATHSWLMGAERWLYVLTGFVYLLPLIGNEPIRWRLPFLARPALILLGMTPDTVVGIVLLQTTYDMFPVMEGRHPSWAPAPVDDLHIGGALMWVGGDGLMMLFGVGVIVAMISHPRSDQIIGRRLESIRRRTLTEHIVATGGAAPADNADVDSDEAMLEAYNRMLARMNGQPDPAPTSDT